MKNPKLSNFLAIFMLLVATSLLSAVKPIHPSSSLNVTVSTDKEINYHGNAVNIYGNLTEDGSPVAGLVAIEVRTPPELPLYPRGRPYIARVVSTGPDPTLYGENISITNVWPSDSWGNLKNSFRKDDVAYFKVRIRNIAEEPQLIKLITLNVFDANLFPIGVVSFGGIWMPPNRSQDIILNFGDITDDASVGTATVYANHFSAWPHAGGSATYHERNATFQITGSGGGGGGGQIATQTQALTVNQGPEGTYSLSFKLPLWQKAGDYVTYATARYHWKQAPTKIKIFTLVLIADLNGDGVVDSTDDGTFGFAYGSIMGEPNYNPACDFDESGAIDSTDDGAFGIYWGAGG